MVFKAFKEKVSNLYKKHPIILVGTPIIIASISYWFRDYVLAFCYQYPMAVFMVVIILIILFPFFMLGVHRGVKWYEKLYRDIDRHF